MCGLAGFAGIPDENNRIALCFLLGLGVDDRGGDAAGFLSVGDYPKPRIGRKLGQWLTAKPGFVREAIRGSITALHARFATCGGKTIKEAHPYEIKRAGKPVLWGMHNGCLYNAHESASRNGRKLNVDSTELFELLADNDLAGIRRLEGYGVIVWSDSAVGEVKLARLSDSGEIYICKVEGGGIVWGSTEKIVQDALQHAGMTSVQRYKIDTGTVYAIRPNGEIYYTPEKNLTVSARKCPSVFQGFDWRTLEDLAERLESEEFAEDSESFDAGLDGAEDEDEEDTDAKVTHTSTQKWRDEMQRLDRMWENSLFERDCDPD